MSWSSIPGIKPMPQKVNLTLLTVLLARVHPQPLLCPRSPKFLRIKESFPLPPSSKYNILNQLANIKEDACLLDMVVIPKQQMHLKQFMEGKDYL
jgi:hypothetical protein